MPAQAAAKMRRQLCGTWVAVRSGIAMLYAHWEGFIKSTASTYLEFVSRQKRPYQQLSDNFVCLAIRKMLHEASESLSIEKHRNVVSFMRNNMNHRSEIPYKGIVKTRSNLNADVLYEIVSILGIDYAPYETKRNLIDEGLLAARNSIAHGNYLRCRTDDYIQLHTQVLGLMQTFHDQVEDAAIGFNARS